VKACHDASAAVRRISSNSNENGLEVNRFNQLQLNWNALLANERQTNRYQAASDKAKEKAQALLPNVPDPDKTLAQKVDGCDSGDEQ